MLVAFDYPGKVKNLQTIGSIELFYDVEPSYYTLIMRGKFFDFWIIKGILGHIKECLDDDDVEISFFPIGIITMSDLLKIENISSDSFYIEITSLKYDLYGCRNLIYYIRENKWNNLDDMLNDNTVII